MARPRDGRGYRLPSETEWTRAAAGSQPGCYFDRTDTRGTCRVGSYGPNPAACRTWCRMSLSGHRIAGRATAGAVRSAATPGAAVPVSRAPTRATAPPPLAAGPYRLSCREGTGLTLATQTDGVPKCCICRRPLTGLRHTRASAAGPRMVLGAVARGRHERLASGSRRLRPMPLLRPGTTTFTARLDFAQGQRGVSSGGVSSWDVN